MTRRPQSQSLISAIAWGIGLGLLSGCGPEELQKNPNHNSSNNAECPSESCLPDPTIVTNSSENSDPGLSLESAIEQAAFQSGDSFLFQTSTVGSRHTRAFPLNPLGKTVEVVTSKLSAPFTFEPNSAGSAFPGARGNCETFIQNTCQLAIQFVPQKGGSQLIDGKLHFSGSLKIYYHLPGTSQLYFQSFPLKAIAPKAVMLHVTLDRNVPSIVQDAFPDRKGGNVFLPKVRISSKNSFGLRIVRSTPLSEGSFSWKLSGEGISEVFSSSDKSCRVRLLSSANITDCAVYGEVAGLRPGTLTGQLELNYFDGYEQVRQLVALETYVEDVSFSEHVLVVYNDRGNGPNCTNTSCRVLRQYLEKRSNVEPSSMNTVGINVPYEEAIQWKDAPFDTTVFVNRFVTPIANWMTAHPEKVIQYIVLMPEIPFRTSAEIHRSESNPRLASASTAFRLRTHLLQRGLIRPDGGLVMHMDMGSEEATLAYINKVSAANRVNQSQNFLISGLDANLAGSTYFLNDEGMSAYKNQEYSAYQEYLNLLKLPQINSSRVQYSDILYSSVRPARHAPVMRDPAGFQTWGWNAAFASGGSINNEYMLNGTYQFSGKASWYIIKSIESHNGWSHPNSYQGNFTRWFSRFAFGGTNYTNNPIGAVIHTDEPTAAGVHHDNLFACWESGKNFAECAWSTCRSAQCAAVGDPLVNR